MSITKNVNAAAAVLWASAFVLAAMVIVQAGRMPGSAAYADVVAESNDYTLLTVDSGRGERAAPYVMLYVIDSRDEVLLVYEVPEAKNREIMLRGGAWLDNTSLELLGNENR